MNNDVKCSRTLVGRVVSAKMQKSIVVRVERRVKHPIYQKYIRRSTKLLAHDEQGLAKLGNIVSIKECRPLAKNKSWTLQEVLQHTGEKTL